MQQPDVEKREVEELLGAEISEDLFRKALEYAKRKQAYIFSREKRSVVMEHWYLVKLTEECARSHLLFMVHHGAVRGTEQYEKRTGHMPQFSCTQPYCTSPMI